MLLNQCAVEYVKATRVVFIVNVYFVISLITAHQIRNQLVVITTHWTVILVAISPLPNSNMQNFQQGK